MRGTHARGPCSWVFIINLTYNKFSLEPQSLELESFQERWTDVPNAQRLRQSRPSV
ncbi:unnamed protein product [Chondrus crispus]|uniref:Uncharacterized protein n=1 Tax=Chondrus crispus TaxID=2769 RepID=R7Q651_CHOCR|nr:unnamed protein product [Chondrus crispus]CDF32945.1 unnamed protein product [Chondrus crispus]|eukprot:XP_005712748.1 unnamed protein product [Chondrus crispus]